jgi:hypothetical protein
VPADPFGLQDDFDFASNVGPGAFATCEAFGAEPVGPEAEAEEPVVSAVPTLLMAGRFDPVTPPDWAEQAAETLSEAMVVVAPAESHGVSPGPCGTSVVLAFLDDPGSRPDTTCLDQATLSLVAAEGTTAPELTEFTVSDGPVSFTGVAPEGWRHGGAGDFYREESFLDTTQLVHVVGDEQLAAGIVQYVADEWGLDLSGTEPHTDPSGVTWQRRSDASTELAVEWYERQVDGRQLVMFLAASPGEIGQLAPLVLEPALERMQLAA